jgi:diketogulonate reductase-like aldo/keto reductase
MQSVEANGARIPSIGFGTMTLKDEICIDMVQAALQAGYRHLDTAQMYGNEAAVGEGLRSSGIPREEVFVTTKVWWTNAAASEFDRSVDGCLALLNLSAVDLLLVHWPSRQVPLAETITALCRAKRAGLARHVGVANFTAPLLDQALSLADEPLVTNQIEVHPFIDQSTLIAACRRHGLAVTAYCPIGRGRMGDNEVLATIGGRHAKSAAQVSLRYLVQQGLVPIPRTADKGHLRDNLAIFDFALSAAEMSEIDRLRRPDGRLVNPPHAPQWDAA